MKNGIVLSACSIGIVLCSLKFGSLAFAGDLDDGISTYTDEAISADDEALKAEKNIGFIIQRAQAQAEIATNGKDKNKNSKFKNFKSGKGDNNENSIVVGAGAKTGDIINVVIEKK